MPLKGLIKNSGAGNLSAGWAEMPSRWRGRGARHLGRKGLFWPGWRGGEWTDSQRLGSSRLMLVLWNEPQAVNKGSELGDCDKDLKDFCLRAQRQVQNQPGGWGQRSLWTLSQSESELGPRFNPGAERVWLQRRRKV